MSSLRFDQFGSGDSAGDFIESSFTDWVRTTEAITREYLKDGFEVSLFGQSMGASTVFLATACLPELRSVVTWVPDASIDDFVWSEDDYIEEGGQRVSPLFWKEAHEAGIAAVYHTLEMSVYLVQCTADQYVSEANRQVFLDHQKPQHIVEAYDGYPHSDWA